MRHLISIVILLISATTADAQVLVTSAPDFLIKDVDGEQHHLYGYLDSGKHVVIDFFTTNCGPCQTYASQISASYEYFGCNQGDVVYLGINWGSDNVAVRNFDSIWGAHYPSVSGMQGGGNQVVDQFQVQSYPTVLLIAPDRSILNNHIWPPSYENINEAVLAAGVEPMTCTVNAGNHGFEKVPAFSVVVTGKSRVEASLNIPHYPDMQLQVYAADGRLVYTDQRFYGSKSFPLHSGLYIAGLFRNGIPLEKVKFFVP